jgi:hypothetical protein
MSRVLGSLTILELHVLSEEFGQGFMPYPFRFTVPVEHTYEHEMRRYRAELRERLAAGEFDHLRRWIDVVLRDAEIRVDSMVTTRSAVTAAVSATRWQELGFVAVQDDADRVTVTQVSAYDLGAAVGKLAALGGRPGVLPRVAVPSVRVRARPDASPSDETVVVDQSRGSDPLPVIPHAKLIAGGRIYVDHRPPTSWAPDRSREFVGWLSTAHGDYVVPAPYEFAVPVTREQLIARIDRLIAGNVARVRDLRATQDVVSAPR